MNFHPIAGQNGQRASLISQLAYRLLLGMSLTPVAVFGQQADTSGSDHQLQEIVVTAQRREQNLQDTPIAVSAFNQQDLQFAGVTSVQELSHVDPSLNFSGNEGVIYPILRGIGNIDAGTAGNESSVAVYLDDVYYTRLSPAYLALGDIERVEVLNGPQGTLFGRNSSGGALQLFTKDPGRNSELDATIGYANYDTVSGNLYVSTPITDTLAWNLAIGGSHQGQGWGKSITTGEDAYLQDTGTVRSKLLWEPTSKTKVKIVAYFAYTDGDISNAGSIAEGTYVSTPNWAFLGVAAPPGYPNPPTKYPSLSDNSSTFYDTRLNLRDNVREHGYGASVRVDQDVGFANLVSISAFRNSKGSALSDDDYISNNFINTNLRTIDDDISQEFQLKSGNGSRVNWIIGAYYLHNKAGFDPAAIYGDFLSVAVAPGSVENIVGLQTINSYSGYGQVTAPVTDTTNLTLGVRLTKDDINGVGTQTAAIPGFGTTPIAAPYNGSSDAGAFTYRAAIDHHFSDYLMSYASISRGYKAGTYNTLPLDGPPNKAEIVTAYELGFKSEFLDRRVRLNGALFWNQIKDPQVFEVVTEGNITGTQLINAEGARTRGGEVGVDAIAAPGLKLRADATYLDAEYTKFLNAPYYNDIGGILTGPSAGNASGNRLPVTPRWRADLGANYAVDSGVGQWVGDVSVAYTSRMAWTADNLIWQGPVTVLNASLNFTPGSRKWMTLSLWGKNLTRDRYFSLVQEQVGQIGNAEFQALPAPPLTFGGSISVKYW